MSRVKIRPKLPGRVVGDFYGLSALAKKVYNGEMRLRGIERVGAKSYYVIEQVDGPAVRCVLISYRCMFRKIFGSPFRVTVHIGAGAGEDYYYLEWAKAWEHFIGYKKTSNKRAHSVLYYGENPLGVIAHRTGQHYDVRAGRQCGFEHYQPERRLAGFGDIY